MRGLRSPVRPEDVLRGGAANDLAHPEVPRGRHNTQGHQARQLFDWRLGPQ